MRACQASLFSVHTVSEKWITYRLLKHQKRKNSHCKVRAQFFVDARMLKHVSAYCTICVISWLHKPNLSSCINLVIIKYELKSQYVKLTQLWPLPVKYVLSLIWQAYYKIVKNLFPLHICRPNDYIAEI